MLRKVPRHICRESTFLTHGENPWKGRSHDSTRVQEERAEEECISEVGQERRGEDGKCDEDSSSHFLFPPKRGRRRARTPFEPWAQKLAHWSPGYCINAAGSRIIFVGKCNEGKRESESGAVNNMKTKSHLLKVPLPPLYTG